jgi:hypothetical protein
LGLGRDLTQEEWQDLWDARIKCIHLTDREKAAEGDMRRQFTDQGLEPLELKEIPDCVRSALRRLAIFINPKDVIGVNKKLKLMETDEHIAEWSIENKVDHEFFALDFLSTDPSRSDNEEKSRCFYNTLRLIKKGNLEKVDFELTTPFLALLYIGQRTLSPDIINGLDPHKVLRESTITYIVRNLFHNFVHIRTQNINERNFHDIVGEQREDFDFEADNYSSILLLKAYGITPITNGDDSMEKEINRRFTLASSNRIFYWRAEFRDREDERLWRMRRDIANKISQGLIVKGRTPTSVKVYINGVISSDVEEDLEFSK